MADRLRVNKLILEIASWVASAMARRVELWDDNLVIPPAFAARTAVLAFGDELVDLKLPDESASRRFSKAGRKMAAAVLLPRAEAALRQELQRLADAVKRVREGQSSSSSGSRGVMTTRRFCWRPKATIDLKSVTLMPKRTNASARPSAAGAQIAAWHN